VSALRHGLYEMTDKSVPRFAVDKGVEGWTQRSWFPPCQCATEELEVGTIEDDRLEVVHATEHGFKRIRRPRVDIINVVQVEFPHARKRERGKEVYPWHMLDPLYPDGSRRPQSRKCLLFHPRDLPVRKAPIFKP